MKKFNEFITEVENLEEKNKNLERDIELLKLNLNKNTKDNEIEIKKIYDKNNEDINKIIKEIELTNTTTMMDLIHYSIEI